MSDKQRKIITTVALTIFSVLINFLCSFCDKNIIFPLYLDSVLTMFLVAKAGLFPGIVCAVASNFLLSLFTPILLPYAFCHICTAVFAWMVFKRYKNENQLPVDAFLYAGLFSALSNGLLGNIITDVIVKPTIPVVHTDYIIQGLYLVSNNLFFSIYFAGLITNLVDKILSALISFVAYKISNLKK